MTPETYDTIVRVLARRWARLAVRLCAAHVENDNPYSLAFPHLSDVAREKQRRNDDEECNALAKALLELTDYPTPPVMVRTFVGVTPPRLKRIDVVDGMIASEPVGPYEQSYDPRAAQAERSRLIQKIVDFSKLKG